MFCCCTSNVQLAEGYYTGLLVSYANSIENEENNLLTKVNKITIYSLIFSLIFLLLFHIQLGIFRKKCSLERMWYICLFIFNWIFTYILNNNYLAYLSANKDTKAIRLTSFIGGICIRIPLLCLIKYFNIGLVGLGLVCTVDRLVRTIYLKSYIKNNKNLYKD